MPCFSCSSRYKTICGNSSNIPSSAAHCHREAPRPKQQLTTVISAHRILRNLERDCKKQSKRYCALAHPSLFSTSTASFPLLLPPRSISFSKEFRSRFQAETTTFATTVSSGGWGKKGEGHARERRLRVRWR